MRDYAASAKARLKVFAAENDETYQSILLRYVIERFLYRLSVSEHRDRCLLKGASLIGMWMADPYRTTRDLDFLGKGPSDASSVARLIASICSIPCPEDGIVFYLESLRVEAIREQAEYFGQRAIFEAGLAQARIRLHVDIGFGDAVEPVEEDYPVLLPSLPAPRLYAYPREYVVAEKFEAMLTLGRRNSRMKDFHDIWALSRRFEFWMAKLAAAVATCLERRRIILGATTPEVLGLEFFEDERLGKRWSDYRASGVLRGTPPPAAFQEIGAGIHDFLVPVWEAIISNNMQPKSWPTGGPWNEG
jgi:predicted nucleotidyltransferase component of viral defense system